MHWMRGEALSSVLTVTLLCIFGLLQTERPGSRYNVLGVAALFIPACYFAIAFLTSDSVLTAAAQMKIWFFFEAAMIWGVAGTILIREKRNKILIKVAFVVLAALVTNDVLRDLRVIRSPAMMDTGFSVFLISLIISQLVGLRTSWTSFAHRKAQLEHEANIGRISKLLTHDLRNKVAAIAVQIEKNVHSAEARGQILSLVGRIKESVDLHLSEATGKTTPGVSTTTGHSEPQKHNPACSVGGAVQLCLNDIRATHKVQIDENIPQRAFLVFVRLELSSLTRCISNLLLNAIEASTENTPSRVAVSVYLSDKTCEIAVKDSGIGFTEKALKALSEGTPLTTKQSGNGFGLLSVKTVLAKAGGEIKIHSDSSGTLVRITLPRTAPPDWALNLNCDLSKAALMEKLAQTYSC